MKNLFLTIAFSALSGMAAMAQSNIKQEPVKQQEPAKKEASKPAPAPAAEQSKTDSKPGSTEKMAITEQGVDKNKGNKKKSASATTTPPATDEKKK